MDTFEQRAKEAEALVETLRSRVAQLKQIAEEKEIAFLLKDNERLVKEVEAAKAELVAAETKKGIKQVALPAENGAAPVIQAIAPSKPKKVAASKPVALPAAAPTPANADSKPKAAKAEKKKGGGGKKPEPAAAVVDVTRLNFIVGKIIKCTEHPESEVLFVEEIDCGEKEPRQILSGLNGNIPLAEMQNRLVVILANLKPMKLRGLLSSGMVMCASQADGPTEIIDPPADAVPGDKVTFEGYSAPDKLPDPELKPKKKIWEKIAPDLATNADRVACYLGVPFTVEGKGVCTAKSLTNVPVK